MLSLLKVFIARLRAIDSIAPVWITLHGALAHSCVADLERAVSIALSSHAGKPVVTSAIWLFQARYRFAVFDVEREPSRNTDEAVKLVGSHLDQASCRLEDCLSQFPDMSPNEEEQAAIDDTKEAFANLKKTATSADFYEEVTREEKLTLMRAMVTEVRGVAGHWYRETHQVKHAW